MRSTWLIAAYLLASTGAALAQSGPDPLFYYGFVPTAAQWNSYFMQKQDTLNFPPVNKNGDVLLGRLVTSPAPGGGAGFNLPTSSPTQLQNGDVWMGGDGLYYFLNGQTVGPVLPSCIHCALTNVTNTFTAGQVFNLNPIPIAPPTGGTVLQIMNQDGQPARYEADAFGNMAGFTGIKADGSAANPTALLGADASPIVTLNAYGYNGVSFVGPQAALRCWTGGDWSPLATPTSCEVATTPSGSTTLASAQRWWPSGGTTVGSPTGGDKGLGTINTQNGSYVNGVGPQAVMTLGTWTPTLVGSTTAGTPSYTARQGSWTSVCAGAAAVNCRITADFYIQTTTTGSPAGFMSITGLPFAGSASNVSVESCSISTMNGFTLDTGFTWLAAYVASGQTVLVLVENGSAKAGTQIQANTVTGPSLQLTGVCSYRN